MKTPPKTKTAKTNKKLANTTTQNKHKQQQINSQTNDETTKTNMGRGE